MLDPKRTPVIVAAAQITDTTSTPQTARSPLGLMVDTVKKAGADSGAGDKLLQAIDSLTIIRLFMDSTPRFKSPFGRMVNPPWSVAQKIGAKPRELLYPIGGGNMPQVMLGRACERIARGESEVAMIAGVEPLRTELAARRAGIALDWNEDAPSGPDEMGGHKMGYSDHEAAHGVRAAINVYPMIENAIRGARGRTIPEHQKKLGAMFAHFAGVAKANPLATRRQGYLADEIANEAPDNKMIGFPYTKLMNASAYVDMSAAVIVCSVAKADELGVPRDKRVYLHGCAQGDDHWFISERYELHRSPAIRGVVAKTFEMAGELSGKPKGIADVGAFDIYSCFTSAVEIACQEIGLAEDDPRGLTVTGGLPYFGGPGNNYVTHSIAEMIHRVRAKPGSFGLVTANGNYVTKHAAGLFSTTLITAPWVREEPKKLQTYLSNLPKPALVEAPSGHARIETYTVIHGKNGPEMGIVMGRLAESNARFVANTADDPGFLKAFQAADQLGRPGTVTSKDGKNTFVPG
jgi:acetyl-CoA C-acetyltransferase